MKDVGIQVICDEGFTHVYNEPVEDWVNWITVDESGEIWAWEKKPQQAHYLQEWVQGRGRGETELLSKLGSCGYSDWKNHIFDIEGPKFPYEGKKIRWIKDVRGATGASLLLSKFAVDCALESGLKGSHDDFVSTVRFVVNIADKFSIPVDYNPNFQAEADFIAALSALKSGEPETLSSYTVEYWKGEN